MATSLRDAVQALSRKRKDSGAEDMDPVCAGGVPGCHVVR